MSDYETTMEVKGLKALHEALKGRLPTCRVGIIGKNNSRKDNTLTNSEVGAAHEYGTNKLPQRSFLRVPLADHLTKEMENSNILTDEHLKKVIATKSIVPWIEDVGMIALKIVLEAFDTCGFGKWKPSEMRYKKIKQTLVETTQLRDSISYVVKK